MCRPGSSIPTTPLTPSSDRCHGCCSDSNIDPGSRGNQGGAGVWWPLGSMPSLRSAEGRVCLLPVPLSCRRRAAWPYSFPAPAANSWERISHRSHSSLRRSPPQLLDSRSRGLRVQLLGPRGEGGGDRRETCNFDWTEEMSFSTPGFLRTLLAPEPSKSMGPKPFASWSEGFRGGQLS